MRQEVIIPEGINYLGVNYSQEYGQPTIAVTNTILDDNKICEDYEKKAWEQSVIIDQEKNDFAWDLSTRSKAYAIFCVDDARADLDEVEDIFETKGIPLCCAIIPEKINDICGSGETIKEVMQRVIANGGEILSHSSECIYQSSSDAVYEKVLHTNRRMLYDAGFEVHGIMMAGDGTSDVYNLDTDKAVRMMRPYFKYSDLYGVGSGVTQYDWGIRTWIQKTNLDALKSAIDVAVANSSLIYFGFHGIDPGDTTEEILTEVIDYIAAKGTSSMEVVTMGGYYDKFKSSKLEQRIKALES